MDLKPNNIVIGDADDTELHKIRIIDFGISKKFRDINGNHINCGQESIFQGNFVFASVNAHNYITLSRRDDLIQLCYLLVYLLDGDLPFIFNNLSNDRV